MIVCLVEPKVVVHTGHTCSSASSFSEVAYSRCCTPQHCWQSLLSPDPVLVSIPHSSTFCPAQMMFQWHTGAPDRPEHSFPSYSNQMRAIGDSWCWPLWQRIWVFR